MRRYAHLGFSEQIPNIRSVFLASCVRSRPNPETTSKANSPHLKMGGVRGGGEGQPGATSPPCPGAACKSPFKGEVGEF